MVYVIEQQDLDFFVISCGGCFVFFFFFFFFFFFLCVLYEIVFSFQILNAARQLSHIEAAPDKSGLVLLDYWVGLKRCLVIIHN